jgi:predicted ATPase/DNA-binding SARP family transcriptional activator
VEALADGERVDLGGPKQRALLVELLLHEGEVVSREHLIDAIWGEEPPASARTSLQVYVHGLRRALGPERIETRGTGYRLAFDPDELDAQRFDRLVREAARALDEGRPAQADDDLTRALAAWQGEPLADLAELPSARTAASALAEQRQRALELRIEARLRLGEHDAAIPELEEQIADDPFRERLRELYVLALYRSGRQKEALEAYREARRTLVDELGVEPGPALQELERAVLRQDPALDPPAREESAPVRLPSPPTPLVGRRLEVAAVEALLRRDGVRLVTLTGPGGTGKTRLARAVATGRAPELRDGASFVDLSQIVDPALVHSEVARALGVEDGGDLLGFLRDRSLLLVLDNLEQLGAGVGPVAELVAAAPRLRVLATSRAPLRLQAEHEYAVPPLPLDEAVRLFSARAQAADPTFSDEDDPTSVAEICRRLDGLPLALELAAARVRSLTPRAIVERITRGFDLLSGGARDLPLRQRTLRATLDWSHELLGEDERTLLARLAVFSGGWTLADLEAIVDGDPALALTALLETNLVRRRGERYSLLETVRAYALERLDERGESAEYRRRHAVRFLEAGEIARDKIMLGGERTTEALDDLRREQDNLRAALAWAVEHSDVDVEVRLCNAQRWYWLVSGQNAEARRAYRHAVEASVGADDRLHALALHGEALFAVKEGDFSAAQVGFEAALELFRALDDPEWVGRCIAELGSVAVAAGELARARELYLECIELFEPLGDDQKVAIAVANIAAIAAQQDDAETAAEYGRRAIELQRRGEYLDDLAVSLANLARVLLAVGQRDEARAALYEATELASRIGYQLVLAHTLSCAAELAADDDPETAARLLGASVGLFSAIGIPIPDDELREHDRTRERLTAALGEDAFAALVEAGSAAPSEAMIEESLAVAR